MASPAGTSWPSAVAKPDVLSAPGHLSGELGWSLGTESSRVQKPPCHTHDWTTHSTVLNLKAAGG